MSQQSARYIGNPLFDANPAVSSNQPHTAIPASVTNSTSYYDPHAAELSASARRQAFVYGSASGGSAFYGSTADRPVPAGRHQRPRSHDHLLLSTAYDRYSTNTESTVLGSSRFLDVPGFNNRYSMDVLGTQQQMASAMPTSASMKHHHSIDSPEMARNRARYE